MTLDQVIAAGLPATVEHQGAYSVFTIDYLPDNEPRHRFRVSGGPFGGLSFGPGGEHTPQDGWRLTDA